MRKFLTAILILLIFSLTASPVSAQDAGGPVYIVQSGDTLSSIASRFNVTVDDLMTANNITDANLLAAGQQLAIPGLTGVSGVLNTELINFGDSYRSLMRRTQISEDIFRKLNHIVSPTEFYVGASMIITQQQNAPTFSSMSPAAGESMLEMAVRNNTDVWTVSGLNALAGTWAGLPGDTLFAPVAGSGQPANGLPSAFESATIRSLPLKQGGTGEIIVKTQPGVTLGGFLVDQPLHFFDMGDGSQVALQGVYVELTPGVYPVRLDATLPDGSKQSFEQMILVKFGVDNPDLQSVPPMDPAIFTSESQQVASIVSTATPTKYWQDQFILPVGLPYCIKEWFGTPRSYTYNGSDYNYFHSGVDYGVCSGDHPFDIYAAASGKVVFVGLLAIRGNTTIVDNGWGVYTLYGHQSRIDVTVGQEVQAGETIGQIGETGHVTGPHLHWELWVNNIQVNPLDWLNQTYP
jgi:murein DD-endopeptidase MepM/ murein hydrolase activator NlpD